MTVGKIFRTAKDIYSNNVLFIMKIFFIYILISIPGIYFTIYAYSIGYIPYCFLSLLLSLLFSPLSLGLADIFLRLTVGERASVKHLFIPYSLPKLTKSAAFLTFLSDGCRYIVSFIAAIIYYYPTFYSSFISYSLYMLLYIAVYAIPIIYRFLFQPAIFDLAIHQEKTAKGVLENARLKMKGHRMKLLRLSIPLYAYDFVSYLVLVSILAGSYSVANKTIMYSIFSIIFMVPICPFLLLCECIYAKNILSEHTD